LTAMLKKFIKSLKPCLWINIILVIFSNQAIAQRDIIYKKDSTIIRCKILKATADKYEYAFIDLKNKTVKTSISGTLVDSVHYNFYDSNLVKNKVFDKETKPEAEEKPAIPKNWKFTFGIGLNAGNFLEFNTKPPGTDKKSFSATGSFDLGLNYAKEGRKFEMTNELHCLTGFQKNGITNADHIQRISDNITSLHDFSSKIGKSKKWNFNLIARAATSIFNIYDGDYLKDINNLGQIQGFLSPYDATISPGIKYEPDKYSRISLSPYSFNLYGVKSRGVSSTGKFIQELDSAGNYKQFLFKRLGAEINFWYDRTIKDWIFLQYRLSISSNYFEKIAKNGLLDGLFITKIKLIKNLYLTDQVDIKGDLKDSPFKPYIKQSVMLSFMKSY
jgi:hypothetical protein